MLFTRRNQSRSLSLNDKIIRHEDYMEYLKIKDLLNLAKEDIDHSRQKFLKNWQQQKSQMLAELETKIKYSYTEKMISVNLLVLQYLSSQENKILEVVIHSLQDMITRLRAKDIMRAVIAQALDMMREQHKLTLRVHRSQLAMTKKMLRSILRDYPSVSIMEVVIDEQVEPNTCILDGGMGSIHSDLQLQISHIKQVLLKILG